MRNTQEAASTHAQIRKCLGSLSRITPVRKLYRNAVSSSRGGGMCYIEYKKFFTWLCYRPWLVLYLTLSSKLKRARAVSFSGVSCRVSRAIISQHQYFKARYENGKERWPSLIYYISSHPTFSHLVRQDPSLSGDDCIWDKSHTKSCSPPRTTPTHSYNF
jgi:hypothetical protein